MSLDLVHAALDAASAPVAFFLRDDDGGWDDDRLFSLLDCTQAADVPIDLAMIPQATGLSLAARLTARMDPGVARIGVHQHGFTHANHEHAERKCEFGVSRSNDAQRADLAAGRARLRDLFGTRLDPIFTPPWNRCSAATPLLLAEMGYAALSRDRGARQQHALPEIAVDLDWSKQWRLAAQAGEDGGARIARELARCIELRHQRAPVGVMLHHAAMDAAELGALARLLSAVKAHPRARWRPMRDVSVQRAAALQQG